jgi:hypothetical protein
MSVPGFRDRINTFLFRYCHVLSRSLSRRFSLMSGDPGGGGTPPLTLIYRGLPPIKLLLFRAFPNIVTNTSSSCSLYEASPIINAPSYL